MAMRTSLKGHHGWLVLAAVVVALDLTAGEGETLSHAAQRAMDRYPLLTVGFITCTATHLLVGHNKTYSRVDPYRLIGLARRLTA